MAEELTAEDLSLVDSGDTKDTEVTVPEWAQKIEDQDIQKAVSKFESEDDFVKILGFEIDAGDKDWREGLDDDLKKVADRFTSREDAIRAIQAFQKREGQVRVPGKDASDDERKAYFKAIGVPESPQGYEFPQLTEEQLEVSGLSADAVKERQNTWAQRFHSLNIPKDAATKLMDFVRDDAAKENAAALEADKHFAKQTEDSLRSEWKGEDFDRNKTLANRAFNEIANRAGLNVDDLRNVETKDGRFLLDRPEILKLFAVVGREMAEGTLGPTLTDAEKETLDDEIETLRKQIAEAQAEGNSKKANKLYEREQALIAKKQGDQPIVGAAGRTV